MSSRFINSGFGVADIGRGSENPLTDPQSQFMADHPRPHCCNGIRMHPTAAEGDVVRFVCTCTGETHGVYRKIDALPRR